MRGLPYLFLLIVFSCSTYAEEELEGFDNQIKSYVKEKKITFFKTEEGVYYNIKQQGIGRKIIYGDSVLISYKGVLLDGTLVDEQKKPIWFAVKDLIAGWKYTLTLINKNSVIELIIPPQLGYGDHKLQKIPKNSILFYEVKVVDIH